MGWRDDNQREIISERDMRRWSLRDRLLYRARGVYWFVALAVLFALYLGAQCGEGANGKYHLLRGTPILCRR